MATVPVEGGPTSGPTVLRMLLGAQLRRLRESAAVSRESAGWEIRSSESKISRMELGRVGFKERDVADLLTLYGVAAPEDRAALLKLARDANSPGWWHRYGDVLPSWFQSYLGLEAATALIRTYEVQFVPGLLQTAAYAREVILLGHRGATPAELDRRVDLRMERQELLRRANPPQLWAVLDEAVLRRPIGGAAVMREQLDALIQATAAPHVRLQIVPFTAGGHAAASGAFSILRFGDEDLPDIVYIEQLTSAIYLDKRDDLDYYAEAMERLCAEAAPPERTRELLARVRDELYPA
ncbi:helix-turn-helix domain-containing protein [Micromonospora sp. NPDC049282]|uniref:helix-turn-helix domain-containing protein n=1 Tax=Micromonospora sp. NPDC049282 TaxID=3364269 RepID=UPI0037158A9E